MPPGQHPGPAPPWRAAAHPIPNQNAAAPQPECRPARSAASALHSYGAAYPPWPPARSAPFQHVPPETPRPPPQLSVPAVAQRVPSPVPAAALHRPAAAAAGSWCPLLRQAPLPGPKVPAVRPRSAPCQRNRPPAAFPAAPFFSAAAQVPAAAPVPSPLPLQTQPRAAVHRTVSFCFQPVQFLLPGLLRPSVQAFPASGRSGR